MIKQNLKIKINMYSQELLNKYKIKINIDTLLDMWNESHRSYHNLEHLNYLVNEIDSLYQENKIDEGQSNKLILVALFHDIIYDPNRNDNEEKSADFFLSLCEEKNADIIEIKDAILDTKTHNPNGKLSKIFSDLDMDIIEKDFDTLLKWENGIRKEYSKYDNDTYKIGRLEFLDSLLDKYPNNTENLLKLINWVKNNY